MTPANRSRSWTNCSRDSDRNDSTRKWSRDVQSPRNLARGIQSHNLQVALSERFVVGPAGIELGENRPHSGAFPLVQDMCGRVEFACTGLDYYTCVVADVVEPIRVDRPATVRGNDVVVPFSHQIQQRVCSRFAGSSAGARQEEHRPSRTSVSDESSAPSIETIVDRVGHSSENPIEGDSDGTNRFLSSFVFD